MYAEKVALIGEDGFGGTAGLCGRENDIPVTGDNGGGRNRARVELSCEEPRAGPSVMPKPLGPTEGGRLTFTDGGFDGGASGGGSFVGNGVGFEFIKLDSAFSWASSVSSSGSCALGTISERKSRSSVDRAIDLRSDPGPLAREKRFRKRETADGAGVTAEITTSGAADELAAGDEGMKTAGVRAGEISRFSDAWCFVLSTLERADMDGDRAFSIFASVEGTDDDDDFRFQNESNPVPCFFG